MTTISPDGQYEKWDGTKWVKDEVAETAARLREAEGTKSCLLQIASEKIAPLQDAVDLDIATRRMKKIQSVGKLGGYHKS